MLEKFKVFRDAVLAGILIGIGGTIFLSVDSRYLGAFLFAIGLFVIVTRQFNLFTGKVGYFKPSQPKFLLDLLLIWLGNLLGTSLVGYGLRLTRIVNIGEKAQNLCEVKLEDNLLSIFILSIFCGLLMFIAADGFKNLSHSIAKFLSVFLSVAVFILCGFEHCVANMFYFSIANAWSWKALLYLLVMTGGNALGGLLIPAVQHQFGKRRIPIS